MDKKKSSEYMKCRKLIRETKHRKKSMSDRAKINTEFKYQCIRNKRNTRNDRGPLLDGGDIMIVKRQNYSIYIFLLFLERSRPRACITG